MKHSSDGNVVSVYELDSSGEITPIEYMGVVAGLVFNNANSVECDTDGFASGSDVSWNVVDLSGNTAQGVMVYDAGRNPSTKLTHDPSFNNVLTFKCDASGTFDHTASMYWFMTKENETYPKKIPKFEL